MQTNLSTENTWTKYFTESVGRHLTSVANKGPSSQSYGFSSSHVQMWELDYKESWVLKNWCFCTAMFGKTPESLLDCKEIQPVHPKGNQSWIFIGRTDAEAETPILWPPNVKNRFIRKDPDAGKDWRQEERGWQRMRWLDGITNPMDMSVGVGDEQGSLACCSPWGRKESDTTERLNWTEFSLFILEEVVEILRSWTLLIGRLSRAHHGVGNFVNPLSFRLRLQRIIT